MFCTFSQSGAWKLTPATLLVLALTPAVYAQEPEPAPSVAAPSDDAEVPAVDAATQEPSPTVPGVGEVAPAAAEVQVAPEPAAQVVIAPVARAMEPESVPTAAPLPPADDTPPPAEAQPNAGHDRGFFIQSVDGKHKLVIRARVQARYEYIVLEPGVDTRRFLIPRARLSLKGHAYTPDLTYKFQTDFGKGGAELKDFYADYEFMDTVRLRVGQYKKPFSRQQLTSSGKQQFVDRDATDKAFGAGRDIGLMLHNGYSKSPTFEYALGIFNGTGDKASYAGGKAELPGGEVSGGKFSNVPDVWKPTVVLRTGYNSDGLKGYSEADLEGGPLRYGFGASIEADFDADGGGISRVKTEYDYVLKLHGLFVTGALFRLIDQGVGDDGKVTYYGYYNQVGYVVAECYEPALRLSAIHPQEGENERREIALALSIYPFGHGFKWQTDIAAITYGDALDQDEVAIRSQLQLAF